MVEEDLHVSIFAVGSFQYFLPLLLLKVSQAALSITTITSHTPTVSWARLVVNRQTSLVLFDFKEVLYNSF